MGILDKWVNATLKQELESPNLNPKADGKLSINDPIIMVVALDRPLHFRG